MQRAQQASSDLQGKQAAFDAAQAASTAAQRQTDVLEAQKAGALAHIAQGKAQKAQADANLQRMELRATVDGRVTKLTAAVGALAVPGQSIMIVVPLDVWVTANFKESQLANMKVGQPVTISIDAYGRSFSGHVNSIQAGSGYGLQSAAWGERHRKLCEDGAARTRQDHVRSASGSRAGTGHVGRAHRHGSPVRRHCHGRCNGQQQFRIRQCQSMADRRSGFGRDVHGGAGHHHRQCRTALYLRRPRGEQRRSFVGGHGAAFAGLGYSLVYPSLGVEAVRGTSAENRGLAMGIYTVFLDVAMALGSPTLGWIADRHSLNAVFLVSAAVTLCTTAVALHLAYGMQRAR